VAKKKKSGKMQLTMGTVQGNQEGLVGKSRNGEPKKETRSNLSIESTDDESPTFVELAL